MKKDDIDSISFLIKVTSDGEPYNLSEFTNARLVTKTPSGASFLQDCNIADAIEGLVEVALLSQSHSETGLHLGEIHLSNVETTVVTQRFEYISMGSITEATAAAQTEGHEAPVMKLLPYKIRSVTNTATEVPYGVTQLKAPEAWSTGERGGGCVVAVLDTGADVGHADLRDQIIGGKNFTNEGSSDNYHDLNGHGTHVAGTIAASENGVGVVGVAPDAKLLICKVLNGQGSGDYRGITKAIKYATKWRGPNGERVRVINMSLGGPIPDSAQYQAILDACAAGIVVVVASGNEGDADEDTHEYGYPALYNECVTVAACDERANLASFSNNHKQVDVIAAGVNVLSTYPTGQYASLSGTSMATPHVAGALALIVNRGESYFGRTLTESEIFALLVKCSNSLGFRATSEGHGLPDLSVLNTEYRKSE